MKKKLFTVLALVAVLMALLTISISAASIQLTRDDVESIVVTDGNPRADKIEYLFDGVLTVTNVDNDGPYNEWYGNVGDTVTITLKEEMQITTLALYITGNWCTVDVYGIDSTGAQTIYGTAIGEHNLNHVDGEFKLVYPVPPEDGSEPEEAPPLPVKTIKLVVTSFKWNKPRTLKVSEVYAEVYHEHSFTEPGDVITPPTCAVEGSQAYYCFCGEGGTLPIPATGEHDIGMRIVYRNGYHEEGSAAVACATCDTQDTILQSAPALFSSIGYSVSQNGKNGVTHGVNVNISAISEYNKYAKTPIEYGMVAASRGAFSSGNPLRLSSTGIVASSSVIAIKSFTDTGCSFISYGINGFADIYKDTQLIISAYIYDGSSIHYLSENSYGTNIQTVSYNGILNTPSAEVEAIINKED